MAQDNFRHRSNTVPAKLPSDTMKEIKVARHNVNNRLKKFSQTDAYSDYERTKEAQKGPKKYLKPIAKQNKKIPADALEDPLASSGRPQTQSSERHLNSERQKRNGISGMDIFDGSEKHKFGNTKKQPKKLSVNSKHKSVGEFAERKNVSQEPQDFQCFRPRASTLSPDLLRKHHFTRSNSDVELLDVDTANRLNQSLDRLPALRTGTGAGVDQPLHSILKRRTQETARRIGWTEPLPDIPPIPSVTVSFHGGEDELEAYPRNNPKRRSKSMFEWDSPSEMPDAILYNEENSWSNRKSPSASPLPPGSDALNSVLRQFQNLEFKPESAKCEHNLRQSDKHVQWLDSVTGSIMA